MQRISPQFHELSNFIAVRPLFFLKHQKLNLCTASADTSLHPCRNHYVFSFYFGNPLPEPFGIESKLHWLKFGFRHSAILVLASSFTLTIINPDFEPYGLGKNIRGNTQQKRN